LHVIAQGQHRLGLSYNLGLFCLFGANRANRARGEQDGCARRANFADKCIALLFQPPMTWDFHSFYSFSFILTNNKSSSR
jgi:hypothetical protein